MLVARIQAVKWPAESPVDREASPPWLKRRHAIEPGKVGALAPTLTCARRLSNAVAAAAAPRPGLPAHRACHFAGSRQSLRLGRPRMPRQSGLRSGLQDVPCVVSLQQTRDFRTDRSAYSA
jgi:hypothetical protein